MLSQPDRAHLAIYLPHLGGGGAERVMVNLAPALLRRGVDVSFVLNQAAGENLGRIPAEAKLVVLNAHRTVAALPKLTAFLRRARPDVVMACMGHNSVLALWSKRLARVDSAVVIGQHTVMSQEGAEIDNWQHRALPWLYRRFHTWAGGVVAVSEGVANDLVLGAKIPAERITVIHNPVVFADIDAKLDDPPAHPWFRDGKRPIFVAAGRLVATKDFATLLRAFALLPAQLGARLLIMGEGPLRAELERLADELGVAARVNLMGFAANPYALFRAADALIMTSLHEGFGNVLVEAMACGTPVVSTDCPYGPAEILGQGAYGTLVPVSDPGAVARAMEQVLQQRPSSAALRARALAFHVDRITERYLALFAQISPRFRDLVTWSKK